MMEPNYRIWASKKAWIFSEEYLRNRTPSRLAGISHAEENRIVQQQCVLVKELGVKLEVPQVVVNTAWVFVRRLYSQLNLKKLDKHVATAVCFFLACKVEEKPRKLEHVIMHKNRIVPSNIPTSQITGKTPHEKEQKEAALCTEDYKKAENFILKVLGFDLTVDHPHTHVVKAAKMFSLPQDFSQTAYFMASNVLMLTNLPLEVPAVDLSASCIYTALKWSGYPLGTSKDGTEWYKYMNTELTEEWLKKMMGQIMSAIQGCPERLKETLKLRKANPMHKQPSTPTSRPSGSGSSHGSQLGPSSSASQAMAGPSGHSTSHTHRSSDPSRQHHSAAHHHNAASSSATRPKPPELSKRPDGRSMAVLGKAAEVPSCRSVTVTQASPVTVTSVDHAAGFRQESRPDGRSVALLGKAADVPTCRSMTASHSTSATVTSADHTAVGSRQEKRERSRMEGEPAAKKLSLSDYQHRRGELRPTQPYSSSANSFGRQETGVPITVNSKPSSPVSAASSAPPLPTPPQDLQALSAQRRASNHNHPTHARGFSQRHQIDSGASVAGRQQGPNEESASRLAHPPPVSQGSSTKTVNKEGVISSMPENVHLKEAMVMVQDLKDSHGRDRVLYTNAEASRKRRLSQSQEEDFTRQGAHKQLRLQDTTTPKHETPSIPGPSGPESLKIRIKCNAGGTFRNASNLEASASTPSPSPSELKMKIPSNATATPSPSASDLKMKIRVTPDASTYRSSSARSSETSEGLRLRLPVHGASVRGNEKYDQSAVQPASGHEHRHKHSRSHSNSGSDGPEGRRYKKKKSRRHSPHSSSHSGEYGHSHQAVGERSSDNGKESREERENGSRSRPTLNTQLSGFIFSETYDTMPDMIFQPDTPTDVNGGFGPPETPTLENADQVQAHMMHLTHGYHQSMPNHAYVMNSMYSQQIQPPLPPPLPSNPPPPPPLPPK